MDERTLATAVSAQASAPDPRGEKPCRVCRSPIDALAGKCVECESFQDWRRFLAMSATTLSLLVALVSVSAYAVPLIAAALDPPGDELHLRIIQCRSNDAAVRLAATNLGERAGAIRGIHIHAPKSTLSEVASWELVPTSEESILRPQSAIERIELSERMLPELGEALAVADRRPQDSWSIEVELVHFDGRARSLFLPFTASEPEGVGRPYDLVDLREPYWYVADENGTRALRPSDLPRGFASLSVTVRVPEDAARGLVVESILLGQRRHERFWAGSVGADDWYEYDDLPFFPGQRMLVGIEVTPDIPATTQPLSLFDGEREIARISVPPPF